MRYVIASPIPLPSLLVVKYRSKILSRISCAAPCDEACAAALFSAAGGEPVFSRIAVTAITATAGRGR